MTVTADASKIVSYAALTTTGESDSKLASYAALTTTAESAAKIVSYASLITPLAALLEAAAAADAIDATSTGNTRPLAEDGSAADTINAAFVGVGPLAEAGSASDTIDAVFGASGPLLEAVAAADTIDATSTGNTRPLAEAGSAADTIDAVYVPSIDPNLPEAASASDTIDATSTGNTRPLAETASAADTIDAVYSAPAVGAIAEAASAADSIDATSTGNTRSLIEAASASTSIDASFSAGPGVVTPPPPSPPPPSIPATQIPATQRPAPPRDEPYVAVEFDLLDDHGTLVTLLLSNGGMASVVRTLGGTLHSYSPGLTGLPILLGSQITVTEYGQPVRAKPNGGAIQFRLDGGNWIWTAYHWIGRTFRVYEGSRSTPFAAMVDVDADMVLVYTGRVAGFTHDCFTATVETTDASLDIDNPLVTNFYDVTFPVAIQGKPRPTARGKFFSAEPVIVDETAQIYEVQSLPQGTTISEERVGGVPWTQVAARPAPGQWSPVNVAGSFQRIQLGSPPAGQDIRVDGAAGSYTIGQLIATVVASAGGAVDAVALAALDASTQQQQASLVTNTAPVNRLTAIDDFVTAGGCWWGFNPLGQATGAAIAAPDPTGKYLLTKVEIHTLNLNAEQPFAWRIRVGSQRNWQPQSAFDTAVLQSDIAKWSAPALVYEPHYENPNALTLEPRAVDVPLLSGTSPLPADAANEQTRLIAAWGANHTVFNATVRMRPEDINLYDTVELNFQMVTGTFRIVSAIRAIGGGPATLQLWGTLGTVPPAPEPLPLPPPYVPPAGSVSPPGGSGSPPSSTPPPPPGPPVPIVVLSPAAISIQANSSLGTVLAAVHVTMSDGSPFTGSLSTSLISGPAGSTNYITTSTTVPPLVGPPGTALYSITQALGPSYVGTLSPTNLQWWLASSATAVVPYTGHIAAPRPGASLYMIVQSVASAPSYIGDLTPADLAWWQTNTTATVTPYTAPAGLPANVTAYVELSRALSVIDTGQAQFSIIATQAGQSGSASEAVNVGPGTLLYSITQPNAPSYVGNLTLANVAWWLANGAAGTTVVPYTGVLPTPRAGASLYQIIQPGSASDPLVPNYIGDLLPADVTWWQTMAGAAVTLYNPVGAATPPVL